MRLIDDDRWSVRELVVQDFADVVVALLEVFDCIHGQILELRFEVEFQVLALEDLPFEVAIADFVFAEALLQL